MGNTPNRTVWQKLLLFLSFASDGSLLPYPGGVPLGDPPRVYPNRKLTRGARQMSQRERVNRRKAKRRS